MPSTTIKVPVELRDQLAAIAREQHTTLAGAIYHAIDTAAEARFWQDLDRAMTADPPQRPANTVRDLLDSEPEWENQDA